MIKIIIERDGLRLFEEEYDEFIITNANTTTVEGDLMKGKITLDIKAVKIAGKLPEETKDR